MRNKGVARRLLGSQKFYCACQVPLWYTPLVYPENGGSDHKSGLRFLFAVYYLVKESQLSHRPREFVYEGLQSLNWVGNLMYDRYRAASQRIDNRCRTTTGHNVCGLR